MKSMLPRASLAVVVLAGIMHEAHAQEPISAPENVVHVQAGRDEGTGIPFKRDRDCLVLTPLHVVRRSGRTPATLYVLDSGSRRIDATLFKVREGEDIALLKLDPNNSRTSTLCRPRPFPWPRGLELPDGPGEVRESQVSGNQSARPVTVSRSYPNLVVCGARGWYQSGTSGALVSVNSVPVGIVLDATVDHSMEEDGSTCARALQLAAVQRAFVDVLDNFSSPPSWFSIYGSTILPGMGQLATRREVEGVGRAALAVALTYAVVQYHKDATETRTDPDYFGNPRTYEYQVRRHPLQPWGVAAAWLINGAWSAVEAQRYARRHLDDKDEPAAPAPRATGVQVAPKVIDLAGRPSAGLMVNVTF